jgi:hypothetical protein
MNKHNISISFSGNRDRSYSSLAREYNIHRKVVLAGWRCKTKTLHHRCARLYTSYYRKSLCRHAPSWFIVGSWCIIVAQQFHEFTQEYAVLDNAISFNGSLQPLRCATRSLTCTLRCVFPFVQRFGQGKLGPEAIDLEEPPRNWLGSRPERSSWGWWTNWTGELVETMDYGREDERIPSDLYVSG